MDDMTPMTIDEMERFDRSCTLNDLAGAAIVRGEYQKAAALLREAAEFAPTEGGREVLLRRAEEVLAWPTLDAQQSA